MAYNNIESRTSVQGLIPEDYSRDILQSVTQESAAMSMFRHVTMTRAQTRMPIMSALPTAYWVNPTDTGLKQTTEIDWANKYLNAEEIAVIVPIPESVLDDQAFDIWAESKPWLAAALGRTLDAAVFFGTNAPGSFPTNILAATQAAGNVSNTGTNAALATSANGGFHADVDGLLGALEADAFTANGFVATRSVRASLRTARATTGQRLNSFDNDSIAPDLSTYLGLPIAYAMDGLWPAYNSVGPVLGAKMFALDTSQFMLGIRQDMTWKLLDQAVIQDNTGAILYNLSQQDMVAMRVVMRVGWQVSNAINYQNSSSTTRYPAATLTTNS